ncbi:MAG TPA: AMP-binding protein [Anaerolineales bacterium]|nr:AMP-binding protein [Anaerolineales bacterium]
MSYADRPWLSSYKLGPYKLEHSRGPYPQKPLSEIFDRTAQEYPGQVAILFRGGEVKYQRLKRQVDSLANALVRLGLEKGERVCLYLPNCPEFVLGYWAVIKAGGVVVPTSLLRTEEGLLHELNSSRSRYMVCQQSQLERALGTRTRTDLEKILLAPDEAEDGEGSRGSLPRGVHRIAELIAEHDPVPPQVDIDPIHDLCELAFTGGATGLPKGVMLTHANRYANIQQSLPWFMKPLLGGIKGKTSVLLSIPLFHTYGNFIHLSAINLGLRLLILPDARDTEAMLKSIQDHRPFLVPGVPTQFMRLADAGLKRSNSMLFSGSAPLPAEVAQEIRRKTGMPISEGYGLTETSSLAHINLTGFARILGFMAQEKPGIGVPIPDTECRLIDPDSGTEVPFGEPGEIALRGPQVMQGYWPEPGSGLTEDGWLFTGDIAVMDEDGYFHIVDRIKDMVNVSGLKVYTTEVDEILFKHPAVALAAAFGIPDVEIPGSERVMAAIVLKEGKKGTISEQELREYCRQHLPPYAVPKVIEFHDELPLTVSEKVFKRVLREEAIARMTDQKEG